VRNALARARRTIRSIDWFEVSAIRGYVRPTGDPEFQVQVKIGFRLLEREVLDEPEALRTPTPVKAVPRIQRLAPPAKRGKSIRSKR
jgi:hypothetical protein